MNNESDDTLDAESIAELITMVMAADEDDPRMMHLSTIAQLVLAEREACAKIADQFAAVTAALDGGAERSSIAAGMTNIAAAIRARSISSN